MRPDGVPELRQIMFIIVDFVGTKRIQGVNPINLFPLSKETR